MLTRVQEPPFPAQ